MLEIIELPQKIESNHSQAAYVPIQPQQWAVRKDGMDVATLYSREFKEELELLLAVLEPVHTYVKDAVRTECNYDGFMERAQKVKRELHGGMGLATESGEFLDNLKKYLFYAKEFDRVNAKEEISDILWYVAILCDALNVDIQKVMSMNIAKLRARYPEKFTREDATNRDLSKERQILEDHA